ncbi:hypothetical protein Q9K01_07595 [Qipengyuania sp. DY56-A-20]|uniref:Uncharacterized protein n=1 Tax=Qipengyuania benthica TaxID=3067651 RepID=A0ABT9H845_9SPHN|nr:hypothetical protein [Qipengyuania sp. DY56-A-20]MDP4539479.1 hypothetical protein [Qipengyuania sp. DY56-A-20]
MRLKELLENPRGGQMLSAYVLLFAAIGLALTVFGKAALKFFQGEAIEFNRDGILLLLLLATSIPALVKFVRSRHVR